MLMAHLNPDGALIRRARLYDAFVTVVTLGRERRHREAILALADLSPGDRVLDVGCGTGTTARMAKERVGGAGEVHGVDASPEMIALATAKSRREGSQVQLQVALAQHLPFDDSSFDVVLCTMVVHHLPKAVRPGAIAEIFRVLRPSGRLVVVDLAREGGLRAALNPIALLHGRRALDSAQQAKNLIESRGFAEVEAGSLGFRNLGFVIGRKPR
jgi:ubiquinone/menaquinone biosynthesis C-methylase UbiE